MACSNPFLPVVSRSLHSTFVCDLIPSPLTLVILGQGHPYRSHFKLIISSKTNSKYSPIWSYRCISYLLRQNALHEQIKDGRIYSRKEGIPEHPCGMPWWQESKVAAPTASASRKQKEKNVVFSSPPPFYSALHRSLGNGITYIQGMS